MKTLFLFFITLVAITATATPPLTKAPLPELQELESQLLTCNPASLNFDKHLEYRNCVGETLQKTMDSARAQFNDDCRWKLWADQVYKSCWEKIESTAPIFFMMRHEECLATQHLHFYADLLNRDFGGTQTVNPQVMERQFTPDNHQIPALEELRKKLLDKTPSKEIKCLDKPVA